MMVCGWVQMPHGGLSSQLDSSYQGLYPGQLGGGLGYPGQYGAGQQQMAGQPANNGYFGQH